MRPATSWFAGLVLLVVGLCFLTLTPMDERSSVSVLTSLAFIVAGLIVCALYFRVQLHFRKSGVFIFRFGRLIQYERYSDWKRVDLSMRLVPPIEVHRKNGTVWFMPWVGDRSGSTGEMLWWIVQSGIKVPDRTARLNRLGIDQLDIFALREVGKYPRRIYD